MINKVCYDRKSRSELGGKVKEEKEKEEIVFIR